MRDRGAHLERRQRVGDAETEVLMAVNLDGLLEALDHLRDDVADRVGRGAAHRVGNRQRVHVAFGGHHLDDLEEPIELGARGVDGEEDRVKTGFLGGQRGFDRRLHGALDRPPVAVLDHVVAGRNLDDDALAAAVLDDLHLGRDAAREPEDLGFQPKRGDVGDGRLVGRRHGRHAGLDTVHPKRVELLGDGDLFLAAEDDGGLLLAVTQGDVVDFDVLAKCGVLRDLWQIVPGADEPLVCFPGFLHVASEEC